VSPARHLLPAVLSLVAASLPAPAAAGDDPILVLKDGRVIEGVPMAREADAVVLTYANGKVRVALDLVEDFLIEGAALPEPTTDEEKEKRAKGLVPFRGRWVTVAERERALRREIDERRKAIEDYRKHREWRDRYQFKTRNFEFESTQPPWRNEEFADLLEVYFKEFAKVWKTRVPEKWGRLKVCLHSSREDFHRTGGASGGVLAYYRFVTPRELHFYYDRSDPEMSVDCLFHEANHYLTDLIGEGFQYPHWVNESMAEYYGSSTWDPVKKTMAVGAIQQGRLAELRADMDAGKLLSLKDLVTSDSRVYLHYYWGWSFVHFMMETPKYRPKFMKFFNDLGRAPDVDRVPDGRPGLSRIRDGATILRTFLSRMGIREQDLPELQKEWYNYIGRFVPTGVRGYEEAGMRAFRDGRVLRAERLLKSAIDAGSRRGSVRSNYAACLLRKGDDAAKAEALKQMEEACALAPLEAGVWALRGYFLHRYGDAVEGQRSVDLAREMDPEQQYLDPDAWWKLRGVLEEDQ
jgi:hypothetical protein